MKKINNVIKFPCLIKKKRKKMEQIRDEVELILSKYAIDKCDLWAVSLAAGRFASINLERFDGEEHTINFFKNCIRLKESLN